MEANWCWPLGASEQEIIRVRNLTRIIDCGVGVWSIIERDGIIADVRALTLAASDMDLHTTYCLPFPEPPRDNTQFGAGV